LVEVLEHTTEPQILGFVPVVTQRSTSTTHPEGQQISADTGAVKPNAQTNTSRQRYRMSFLPSFDGL
jgi:hypothetical protein